MDLLHISHLHMNNQMQVVCQLVCLPTSSRSFTHSLTTFSSGFAQSYYYATVSTNAGPSAYAPPFIDHIPSGFVPLSTNAGTSAHAPPFIDHIPSGFVTLSTNAGTSAHAPPPPSSEFCHIIRLSGEITKHSLVYYIVGYTVWDGTVNVTTYDTTYDTTT
jgi:hypothetical protein